MTSDEFARKTAMKDLAEIKQADLLILDTTEAFTPESSGGREVEYGYALGHFQTKLVFIVGPKRSAFHALADRHFETWAIALAFLGRKDTE